MSVYSQDNEWICLKHGAFSDFNPADFGFGLAFPDCPKCRMVAEKGLCVDCESHAGTVNFSQSVMDYTHGGSKKICRCCYRKIVEKTYLEAKENFEHLSVELALTPCWPVENK